MCCLCLSFPVQGEDVVAGTRTPLHISELSKILPEQYQQLVDITTRLEKHMKDMQDCEFTVQDGKLYMLQCRGGKRTGAAALTIAVDMFSEGIVNSDQAVMMVEPRHLDQLLHPMFSDEAGYRKAGAVLATGLAASPGAAVGRVVFSADDAEAWHAKVRTSFFSSVSWVCALKVPVSTCIKCSCMHVIRE